MQSPWSQISAKVRVSAPQEQPLILTNRLKPLSFQDRLTALQELGSVLINLSAQRTLTYRPL